MRQLKRLSRCKTASSAGGALVALAKTRQAHQSAPNTWCCMLRRDVRPAYSLHNPQFTFLIFNIYI